MIALRVFGSGGVTSRDHEQDAQELVAQKKPFALLAYLALAEPRGFHRRDRLVGIFWPESEQERARGALRKAVHVVRRRLADDVLRSRGDDDLAIGVDALQCDALEFEMAIESGQLARALELYRGDVLEGFFVPDALEFERWLEEVRTRYRAQAATAAWALAVRHEGDARPTLAVETARRAVALAPLDERVIRKVLAMLDRFADRAGAIALYESFRVRLREDFGVDPAPETQHLIEAIRTRQSVSIVKDR
jgi:serine/threonine-protein kinase